MEQPPHSTAYLGHPLSHVSPISMHAPCEPRRALSILAFLDDYLLPTALRGRIGDLSSSVRGTSMSILVFANDYLITTPWYGCPGGLEL